MSARLVPSQLSGAAVIFFQVAVEDQGFRESEEPVFPANRQNRLVTEVPSKAGIVYLLERDGFVSWFLCL